MNFSSGHVVQEFVMDGAEGFYEEKLPIDMEIVSIGSNAAKQVVIFYVSRSGGAQRKKKEFVVWPSGKGLPKSDFKYFFYQGTVRSRWHVFEVI